MSIDERVHYKIRKLILRDFQNGLTAAQTSLNIEAKYGCVKGFGRRTCQRWFSKFRDGDFNLDDKPSHRKERERKRQKMLALLEASKATKVLPMHEADTVTFRPEANKKVIEDANAIVQKLIQHKPELTVSRVNNTVKRPPVSKSIISSPTLLTPIKKSVRSTSTGQAAKTKAGIRPARLLKTDIKLPPSIAKRMVYQRATKETHSIESKRKTTQKGVEPVKKSITVQFQNVNPDVVKSTVKKDPETPLNANKRLAVPQSTPLASPKGVIYLNPQEIFRQSFDLRSTAARQTTRSDRNTAVPPRGPIVAPKPVPSPVAPPAPIDVTDSDSDDDVVLPENVQFPAPKVKVVMDTFTTYWDMETEKPVLLNPIEDTIATPTIIEIDD